jgi:hypothetical protein
VPAPTDPTPDGQFLDVNDATVRTSRLANFRLRNINQQVG